MQVSDRLAAYVRRTFADQEANTLLDELSRFDGTTFDLQDPERCALAVVLVVQQGVPPRNAFRLARTDWRDLLMAAELAHGNWPTRIAELLADSPR
ncbi:MAG: hypothetical protein ACJ786_33200 [Catenulispora sp.]